MQRQEIIRHLQQLISLKIEINSRFLSEILTILTPTLQRGLIHLSSQSADIINTLYFSQAMYRHSRSTMHREGGILDKCFVIYTHKPLSASNDVMNIPVHQYVFFGRRSADLIPKMSNFRRRITHELTSSRRQHNLKH